MRAGWRRRKVDASFLTFALPGAGTRRAGPAARRALVVRRNGGNTPVEDRAWARGRLIICASLASNDCDLYPNQPRRVDGTDSRAVGAFAVLALRFEFSSLLTRLRRSRRSWRLRKVPIRSGARRMARKASPDVLNRAHKLCLGGALNLRMFGDHLAGVRDCRRADPASDGLDMLEAKRHGYARGVGATPEEPRTRRTRGLCHGHFPMRPAGAISSVNGAGGAGADAVELGVGAILGVDRADQPDQLLGCWRGQPACGR